MEPILNKRILHEIQVGKKSKLFEFFYDQNGKFGDKDLCYIRWKVKDGIYKNQTHVLQIKFIYGSNEIKIFPKNPPNIIFVTSIYHTNIAIGGTICLDVLKEDPQNPQSWSSMYGIETIFNSIVNLLDDHNIKSPFNINASNDYQNKSKEDFIKLCDTYYQQKNKDAKLLTANF